MFLALLASTGALLGVFHDPAGRRAVLYSAALAAGVQAVAFCLVLMASRGSAMKAWGAGAILRFVAIIVYALVLLKPLGLSPVPALLSLAGLLFVTTVLESWLLTS